VATVSNLSGSQGLATGQGLGSAVISATSGSIQGSTTLTVTAPALTTISVTPANPSIPKGTTEQFTATGTYSDGSTQDLTTTAAWASSNTSVATVSNLSGSQGLATGQGLGSAVISATSGSIQGSTTLTVAAPALTGVFVIHANPSIPQGTTEQFTALGTYSDNSTQDLTTIATWASSNTPVATVSNASGSQGLAKGQGVGSAVISATSGSKQGSTTLTVCPGHNNGLGQSYLDCSDPTGNPGNATTYNAAMGTDAANAWPPSGAVTQVVCAVGVSPNAILKQTSTSAAVWVYSGTAAGHVFLNSLNTDAFCPTTADPSWN
jgi:hypothetical protein